MPESQLALSWDNFQHTMQSGIVQMLESENFVDVTLCVEGKKLKAHKIILSVCSPFFKDLFDSNPCQHPIIFLNEVKYRIMKDLLTYMYKGEVLLTQELLPAFVRLGESLQIRGLTNDETNSHPQSNIDNHSNQRIFADSLPLHTSSTPKVPPSIGRRTLSTTRPGGGVRRPAATAAVSTTSDSASHQLPMKRPKLAAHMQAGTKPRFILESGRLSKIEKLDDEELLEDELEGHPDDSSHLEEIQHNYSFTTNLSKQTATSTTKQRRKSTASSASEQPAAQTGTATIIDPMEMELAIIHQGLEPSEQLHGAESEGDDSQHQVIIGGGEDIVLEQELSQDDDGDLVEAEEDDGDDMDGVEHKLMMQTAVGEVEVRADGMEGTGEEDEKEDSEISIVRTIRKQEMPRYIVDGFVFHVNIMKGNPPMTYLRCLEYKRLGCHARAVMPTNGSIQDIQLTQMHNHPPDFAAEEKIVFMRELKDFLLRNMNLSTKEVYDLLQPIYPTAAHETPYETIKNKMGRWKRSFIMDSELDMRLNAIESATGQEPTPKKRSVKPEMIIPD